MRGELSIAQGREPTVEEIAAVLGVTAEETQSLRVVARHPVSLHEPLGGDGERALEDFLDDPDATNPGKAVDQHLLRERIGEVLRSLTPREREVIELRFGLRDGQPAHAGRGGPGLRHHPRAHPPDRGARPARSCASRSAASAWPSSPRRS